MLNCVIESFVKGSDKHLVLEPRVWCSPARIIIINNHLRFYKLLV